MGAMILSSARTGSATDFAVWKKWFEEKKR
jgi:hypothetical protein